MKLLRVTTPSLEIAIEQTGPEDGEPIVLLHGFPYDPRSFDAVRDAIANESRRILVPYLRGYGPTRYLSDVIFRSGQQAALGNDVRETLDALGIARATLVGYDWGGRAACVAAALWPERVRGLVVEGGYTIQNIAKAAITPAEVELEHQAWYQWYFGNERGRAGLEANRVEIAEKLWRMWSPAWFDADLFRRTAESFANPDFVPTVIHSYRHRYGLAPGDPALEPLEQELAKQPEITVPTIALQGGDDRVNPPSTAVGKEKMFTAHYDLRLLPGAGHCPAQELPAEVVRAIEDLQRLTASTQPG